VERLLLRVNEAAELLGISRSKAYELVAAEVIPAIRIGSSVRVPLEELRVWIKGNCRSINGEVR
jgi:excisionase family DNA binding protein